MKHWIQSLTQQFSVVAFSIFLVPFAVNAQSYKIRFGHAERAGSTYHLSASASQTTKTKLTWATNAVKSSEEGFAIELSAHVTILEVNNGWATHKSITVLNSKFTSGTTTGPLLPEGTVVLASIRNDQTIFEVKGNPIDEPLARALRSVITLHTAGTDDDGMFGTTDLKKVGDHWNVNIEGVTVLLKEIGATAKPDDIRGGSTLEKVEDHHLFINSSLHVANFLLPFPEGFKAENGELKTKVAGRIPINPTDLSASQTQEIFMRTQGRGRLRPSGEEANLEVLYESLNKFETTSLKVRQKSSRFQRIRR